MNRKIEAAKTTSDHSGERGAALVTVLMLTFLLLVATGGLLLEASMNTMNVSDATSEEQAYYAAESGVQSVIDALRHNPRPNPLLNPSASPLPPNPDADESNQITYIRAVRRDTSNATNPTAAACAGANPPLDCTPRLSRWMQYNWGPNGGTADPNPDRIVLGNPNQYSPLNGFAFSVRVSDPDNTGGTVSYSTSGGILDPVAGNYVLSRTFGTAPNTTTITYNPVGTQVVNVSSGIGNSNVGTFTMTKTGSGGTIPSGNDLPRFRISVSVSQPQNTSIVIRGYVVPVGSPLKGSVPPDPTSTCDRSEVSYLFDSKVFLSFGSRTTITNTGCMVEETSTKQGPYGTYLTGYLVRATLGAPQQLDVSVTQPEPTRLMIRTTGFGPRGARKELETIVQKNYFNDLGAPAPLLLIGPPCTTVLGLAPCVPKPTPATDFNLDPGNSTPIQYSGKDKKLKAFLPPIGLTNEPNRNEVNATVSGMNGSVFGTVENVANELPFWLQNPKNLNDTVNLLRAAAQASGSYWGPTSNPPTNATGVYGDWASATGITFIEKDAQISGDGGGILVVNGQLNFKGNFKWNGLVLVIGPKTATSSGGFVRNGGGNGELAGNFIIAPYDNWSLNTCMPNPLVPNKLNCFHAPTYQISGGGTSDLLFNSQSVNNGLHGLSNFVKGVAEK